MICGLFIIGGFLVKISAKQSALAALIGEARRRTNENKRNISRDRGRDKNILNNLMGSIGELLAIKWFGQHLSNIASVLTIPRL